MAGEQSLDQSKKEDMHMKTLIFAATKNLLFVS
jgi:hypothetical protein